MPSHIRSRCRFMIEVFGIYIIIITTIATTGETRIPQDQNVLSRPWQRGNVTTQGHRPRYMTLMEIL